MLRRSKLQNLQSSSASSIAHLNLVMRDLLKTCNYIRCSSTSSSSSSSSSSSFSPSPSPLPSPSSSPPSSANSSSSSSLCLWLCLLYFASSSLLVLHHLVERKISESLAPGDSDTRVEIVHLPCVRIGEEEGEESEGEQEGGERGEGGEARRGETVWGQETLEVLRATPASLSLICFCVSCWRAEEYEQEQTQENGKDARTMGESRVIKCGIKKETFEILSSRLAIFFLICCITSRNVSNRRPLT
eukprot:756377-Hanusia_phi.AAC.1